MQTLNDVIALLKFRIRSPAELNLLKNCLPDGQFIDHWLNFRLNASSGNSFFDALQSHGWKWEDGTQFVLLDNWNGGTTCNSIGCLTFLDGEYAFQHCTDNKNYALCEYNLDRNFTLLAPIEIQPIANSLKITSTNLFNNFHSLLKTQVEGTERPRDTTYNLTTPKQFSKAEPVASSNQKLAIIPRNCNFDENAGEICVQIKKFYECYHLVVCKMLKFYHTNVLHVQYRSPIARHMTRKLSILCFWWVKI